MNHRRARAARNQTTLPSGLPLFQPAGFGHPWRLIKFMDCLICMSLKIFGWKINREALCFFAFFFFFFFSERLLNFKPGFVCAVSSLCYVTQTPFISLSAWLWVSLWWFCWEREGNQCSLMFWGFLFPGPSFLFGCELCFAPRDMMARPPFPSPLLLCQDRRISRRGIVCLGVFFAQGHTFLADNWKENKLCAADTRFYDVKPCIAALPRVWMTNE